MLVAVIGTQLLSIPEIIEILNKPNFTILLT